MANRPYDARYEPRPADQARDEDVRYQRFLGALQAAGDASREQAEGAAVSVLRALEQRIGGAEAERIVRTVLLTARALLPEKEASDVAAHLPGDLQDLWAAQPDARERRRSVGRTA